MVSSPRSILAISNTHSFCVHGQCSLWAVRMCTRTQNVRRAHTRKHGAHVSVPSKNVFVHTVVHTWYSKYRRVLVKFCTKEILCTHRLWKIRGNIVHGSLRILRMHFISKASILCSSRFLMVQLSHPCSHRPHQSFHKSHFGGYFMLWIFQICFIHVSALCPLASFPLISLLRSASSVIIDPRYWNVFTCSNLLSIKMMLHILPFNVLILVLSILISSPFSLPTCVFTYAISTAR